MKTTRNLALLSTLVAIAVLMAVSVSVFSSREAEEERPVSQGVSFPGTSRAAPRADARDRSLAGAPPAGARSELAERKPPPPKPPAAAAPEDRGEPDTPGSVWIRAESRQTGEVLPGTRLVATRGARSRGSTFQYTDGNRGGVDESVRTDHLGQAALFLPSGESFVLEAWNEDGAWGVERVELPPLQPLEERELVVQLNTQPDLRFFGQIVAAQDGTPIKSARVTVRRNGFAVRTLQTDLEGNFDDLLRSRGRPYVRVDARRFGPVLVPLEAGHETFTGRLLIPLQRTAKLRVQVLGSQGFPSRWVSIRLAAPTRSLCLGDDESFAPPEKFTWEATSDKDGRRTFDLPAGVPISIELAVSNPSFRLQDAGEVVLQPGETRELVVRLRPPTRVTGRLLVAKDEPVAGREVLIRRSDGRGSRYFECREFGGPWRTFTDGEGRFAFEDVYEGRYLVGPSPYCSGSARPGSESVAPLGRAIQVAASGDAEVAVRVDQGLYIRGRVTSDAPLGKPWDDWQVSASSDTFRGLPPIWLEPDGSFAIGPLQRGVYDLNASTVSPRPRRESDPSRAKPGDEVELKLEPVLGKITGHVVYAKSDLPVEEEVELLGEGLPKPWLDPLTKQFVFEEVKPGTYTLIASAGTRSGSQRVVLEARDGEVHGVTIRLSRGAVLRISTDDYAAQERARRKQYERDGLPTGYFDRHQLTITIDGRVVYRGPMLGRVHVPAGEALIEYLDLETGERASQRVRLEEGEEKELDRNRFERY